MTKDRLKELQSRRPISWTNLNQPKSSREPLNPNRLGNSDDGAPTEVLLPMENTTNFSQLFVDIDLIQKLIDKICEISEEVKILHVQIVQPMANQNLRQKLDQKEDDIKKLSQEVSVKLKKLETENFEQIAFRPKTAQDRIRQSQLFNLAQRFRDVMIRHNHESLLHREKSLSLIRKELEIAGCRISNEEIEKILDQGFSGFLTKTLMVDVESAKSALQNIECRHRDILKLEESIKQIRDMFNDLQNIVATQGDMIDNIEYNVNNAVDSVTMGAVDLDKAKKAEERRRRNKCCLAIILAVVVIVLIILIFSYITVQRKFFRI